MARKEWTKEEEAYLYRVGGTYPLESIVKNFNKRFKGDRTKGSISSKMVRLNISRRTEFDNLTKLQWAKMLGFANGHVMTRWERKGLVVNKTNPWQHYVTVKAMAKFAHEKPYLFYHCDEEVLVYFFGEELTDKILNSHSPISTPRKIRASDGRIFDSQRQASKVLGLSQRTIKRELARENGWLKLIAG